MKRLPMETNEEYSRYMYEMYEEQARDENQRFIEHFQAADKVLLRVIAVLAAVLVVVQIYKAFW
jgi:cell division protein FtsL